MCLCAHVCVYTLMCLCAHVCVYVLMCLCVYLTHHLTQLSKTLRILVIKKILEAVCKFAYTITYKYC